MDTLRQGYYGGKISMDSKMLVQSFWFFKDIIDDRLDTRQFPAVGGQRNPAASFAVQRYGFLFLNDLCCIQVCSLAIENSVGEVDQKLVLVLVHV